MANITPRVLAVGTFTVLLFAIINYDLQFATIFLSFATANALLLLLDDRVDVIFEKAGNNKVISVGIGIFSYFVYRTIVSIISQLSAEESLSIYAQHIPLFAQLTPVLQDTPVLFLVGWGILIPIVETPFFNGRLYEAFGDFAEINLKGFSFGTIFLSVIIGAIAASFHLTARGITETATMGLIITWIFFTLSQFVVIYTNGQLIEATILHIIANSTAIIVSTGLASLTPLIPVVIGLIIVFILRAVDIPSVFSRIFR